MPGSAHTFCISPVTPDAAIIAKAAELILKGGVVAFPTETVYGVGADAFNATAVKKIFAIKQRPANDPIIVHVARRDQVRDIALDLPESAQRLMEKFWPGPLTLILAKHPALPQVVTAGLPNVAIRMPDHPVARQLIETAGVPIAAPSANRFSKPSATLAQHVLEDLSDSVDMILDAGQSPIGVESTVVDLTAPQPTLLRPGGIRIESLKEILPQITLHPKYIELTTSHSKSASPGMLTKHYSPKAKLLFFRGQEPAATLTAMRERIYTALDRGEKVGILSPSEEMGYFDDLPVKLENLGSLTAMEEIARNLFILLRKMDHYQVDLILVKNLPQEGIGLALWDRLFRAASSRVIEVPHPPTP